MDLYSFFQFHVSDSFHLIDRLAEAEYSILMSIISMDASLVVFSFSLFLKDIRSEKKRLRSI
jgi:hypothetical protein